MPVTGLAWNTGLSTPYVWADQIHDLHQKIKEVDAMNHFMEAMDSFLTGEPELDRRTKEQIEQMLNHPESIFEEVVKFDREYHVSGYFDRWRSDNDDGK